MKPLMITWPWVYSFKIMHNKPILNPNNKQKGWWGLTDASQCLTADQKWHGTRERRPVWEAGRRSLGEQQDLLIAGRLSQFLVDKETERERERKNVKESCEGGDWRKKQERTTMNHACLKCIFKSVRNGWWASQTSGSERKRPAETTPSQPTSVTQNSVCILSKHGKLTQRSASYTSRTSAMSLRACFTRLKPISKNCTVSRRIVVLGFFSAPRADVWFFGGLFWVFFGMNVKIMWTRQLKEASGK